MNESDTIGLLGSVKARIVFLEGRFILVEVFERLMPRTRDRSNR